MLFKPQYYSDLKPLERYPLQQQSKLHLLPEIQMP